MVRLVTQYSHLRHNGEEFGKPGDYFVAWDGAARTDMFHTIDSNLNGNYLGPYPEECVDLVSWVEEAKHLNKFRLELIYE